MVTRKNPADVPWEKDVKAPAAKKAVATKAKAAPAAKTVAAKKAAPAKSPIASSDAEEKEPLGPPPAGMKVPKNVALAADLYKTESDEVARLKKEMDKADERRKWLKKFLIEQLPKGNASGVAGKLVRVATVQKETPQAEDWGKVYATIVADYQTHMKKKTGMQDSAFALMQRRLGEAAIKEAWENGVVVPGVRKFTYTDLSVTKVA